MNDQKAIRGFHHFNEAFYSGIPRDPHLIDEIMIGMYYSGGGTDGEFAIRWEMIGGRAVPRLEVFDDAWGVLLLKFEDLLDRMTCLNGKNITPKEMCKILKNLGMKDLTQRENPHIKQEAK